MKSLLCIFCSLAVLTCFGGIAEQLARTPSTPMLQVVESRSTPLQDSFTLLQTLPIESWGGIRDRILESGAEITNDLQSVLDDESADWRARLLSGVCLDRLVCHTRRTLFLADPFAGNPEYQSSWIPTVAGYALEAVPLFERIIAEENHWFAVLEVFSRMTSPLSVHPVFQCSGEVILRSGPPQIRFFAAKIAEAYSEEYFMGINPGADRFPFWLYEYVVDGTYPQGSYCLLTRMAGQARIDFRRLLFLLARNDDVAFLTTLRDRFSNNSTALSLVQDRIAELNERIGIGSVRVELDSLKALPVPEWASIRDRILAQGTECTNELGVIRDNFQEPWQVRFLASLCLERILNDPGETEFFGTPWKSDPDFDPAWISTAAGYSLEEIDLLRRRLREKGYWFGLLDQFAFPDDCGDRHPVFHIGAQILFDDAPEAVRQYAARLSECYASESLIRHDWHYDGYVPWLEAYVLDGTYPEGSTLLLEHLGKTGCRFPEKLRILLSRNENKALLERIRDSPETDPTTRRIVAERLSQLAREKLRLENEPETRSNVSPKSVLRPEKRLPPGVLFRGKNTAPAPPAESR